MNLIFFAIAPVAAVIIYIYTRDLYEKEPKRLLMFSFLFGAIISIIIAILLYFIVNVFLPLPDKTSIFEQFIKAFFVVGVTEEFSKYIIVRYYAQPKPDFNEPFDGIIYAVMVSMGFAATENIAYALDGGYQTALTRAFTAVPAHATFAILMGYYMGKAKFSKNKIGLNLLGLLLAITFHGAYDFFLFIDYVPGIWVGAFISLLIGILLSRRAIKIHQDGSKFKVF